MGSLLHSKTFHEDKRNAFLHAFSKIPQRVLWKWEDDTLQERPSNVMIYKWLPQRDILGILFLYIKNKTSINYSQINENIFSSSKCETLHYSWRLTEYN